VNAEHNPPAAERLDSLVGQVADEFLARQERGERPDIEEYAARYPGAANPIRDVLRSLRLVESAGGAGFGSDLPARTPDELVVGVLGDFRIIREVGRGGMGIVYEAEQISLNRRVALKVLPFAATMDAKQLQRFKNEARAAASLRHEHIVHVYGVGCERGVHHYAMEFIEGLSLAEVIAATKTAAADSPARSERTADYIPALLGAGLIEGSLPATDGHVDAGMQPPATVEVAALSTQLSGPKTRHFYRTAARVIADASEALEHAHSLGIVHRDVKPGNLLVDQHGKIYVTDFGLARLGPDAGLTMSGDVLGTLRYMAPEQALARHGLVDHRADVYGLGCTLYELLSGRPAVDATERPEILRQIAFDDPPPLRKHDKAIPPELETITLKCLSKNAAERYGTAGELANDLRRWLDIKPIRARPPGAGVRLGKWVRRNRPVVLTAACLLVVLAVGLATAAAVSVRYALDAGRARRRAEDHLAIARRAVDDMYTEIAEQWLSAQPRMTDKQRQFLQKALQCYQQFTAEADAGPAVQREAARAYLRVADIQDVLGAVPKAEAASRDALGILGPLVEQFPSVPEYRSDLAKSHYKLGRTQTGMGRNADAEQSFLRAQALWRGLADDFPAVSRFRGDLAVSDIALALLWLERISGRRNDGVATAREALTLLEGLPADIAAEPGFRMGLAMALDLVRWNSPRAEKEALQRRAVKILEKLVADFPGVPQYREHWAGHLYNLHLVVKNSDRREEGEQIIRQSIDLWEALAADFPAIPKYRFGLSGAYAQLINLLRWTDGWVERERCLRRVLDLRRKLVEQDSQNLTIVQGKTYRHWLGEALATLAEQLADGPDPARRDLAQALALAEEAVALDPQTQKWRTMLGKAYYRAGRWADGVAAFESAAELSGGKAIDEDWFFLAMAHWRLSHRNEARDWYARLVGWMEQSGKKYHSPDDFDWFQDSPRHRAEAAELLGIPAEVKHTRPPPGDDRR
jgi:serine/threonine protein kinase